jgi:GT2 family glycosyltransferase
MGEDLMKKPITGVVVLNYNTENFTIRCLNSLLPQLAPGDIIIVVDNQSTDDSGRRIKEKFSNHNNVVYIQAESNLGYSAGNNLGMKYIHNTGADFICICNPDVTVNHDTLSLLKKYLEENPGVCCVGPLIYGSNGKISLDCARGFMGRKEKVFVTTPLSIFDFFGIKRNFYGNFDYSATKEVYMISGSFMMFRAEVLKKTDGFDENIFLFEEESILFSKIHQNNYGRVIFNPECSVIHENTGNIVNPEHIRYFAKSERYYLEKYVGTSKAFIHFMEAIRLCQYLYYKVLFFRRRTKS